MMWCFYEFIAKTRWIIVTNIRFSTTSSCKRLHLQFHKANKLGISWNRLNRRLWMDRIHRSQIKKIVKESLFHSVLSHSMRQIRFGCVNYSVALAFFSSANFHKYFVIRSFTTSWTSTLIDACDWKEKFVIANFWVQQEKRCRGKKRLMQIYSRKG